MKFTVIPAFLVIPAKAGIQAVLGFILLLGVVHANVLPDLGSSERASLSVQEEAKLGQQFMLIVRQQARLVQDPVVNDYIHHLGYALAAYSTDASQVYHFFVVEDPSINAFAGPGGYIGIHSGVLLAVRSESELASVLAHEIGHVAQHHIARMIAEQKKLAVPSIGALLAGILVGTQNPQAGMGVIAASSAAVAQYGINFTRRDEQEADAVAMDILRKAHFDPYAMAVFLKRLAKEERYNNDVSEVSALLLTHPLTEERIAESLNRSAAYPRSKIKHNPLFDLVQARVAVSAVQDPAAALRGYVQKKDMGSQYAYALLLARNGQYSKAYTIVQSLANALPELLCLYMSEADFLEGMHKVPQAKSLLQRLYQHNREYYPLGLQYAQFLLNHQEPVRAVRVLRALVPNDMEKEGYWQTLFQAQGAAGYKADAYETRSKLYLLLGKHKAAIAQLKLALEATDSADTYAKQRIQRMLDDLS